MKILLNFVSQALGDNIAFSAYADAYQKKHNCDLYVKTVWSDMFQADNDRVHFINSIGQEVFDKEIDIRFEFVNKPLQKIICDKLDLDYKEIIPRVKTETGQKFEKNKKYVCISTHSTAQMKYWTDGGWDKTVKYLKNLGYDVYAIDKYEIFGAEPKLNKIPSKAFNETGNHPIRYRIEQLKNCDFFIGLSSGLSWLAWALGKKVVMISGCTESYNEFSSNNYRVINENVCHGCLNDVSIDNKNRIISDGWMYCPRNKNFECSKKISFEMVKQKIDKCIEDL
jgi:autotransporter strand-loop-strand O-heptosyltransferase